MLHDFTVHVAVKDKNSGSIREKVCSLPCYCQEQKYVLTRALQDIEATLSSLQQGARKDEWRSDTIEAFNRIRRNILNAANSMERLPNALHYKGTPVCSMPSGQYVAGFINAITNAEGDSNVHSV